MVRRTIYFFAIAATFAATAIAQPKDTIFDEAQVPAYVLPEPLLMLDGTKVDRSEDWMSKRRPEILKLFEEHVHGRSPAAPDHIEFTVTSTDVKVLGGKEDKRKDKSKSNEPPTAGAAS
jgi:hypothetical protein